MKRSPLRDCQAGRTASERHRIDSPVSRSRTAPRDAPHPVAFDQIDGRIVGFEQALTGFEDRVEDWRRMRYRTADDPQDVRRRYLPLQGFLGLVEQPRVLNGDDGLVGKALQQSELIAGERQEPFTENDKDADGLVLAPERRAAHGAGASGPRMGQAGKVGHRGIKLVEVRNVDLPTLGHHRARQVSAADLDI